MSYSTIENRLRKEFTTAWNLVSDPKRISYVNTPFNIDGVDWYIRFQVINASGEQAAFGAAINTKRIEGMVIVQVFEASNGGNGRTLDTTDKVLNILQLKQFAGDDYAIHLRAGYNQQVNMSTDQTFLQTNVVVPFFADYK